MSISNQMKYWVQVNGNTVGNVVLKRKNKPVGSFHEITECLGLCCLFPTLSLVTTDGATTELINTWSAYPDAVNYRLERSTAADFTTGLTTVYFGSLLTYTNTGLTTGVTYYYRVSAVGASTSAFATSSKIAP